MNTAISSGTPDGNPLQCPICNVQVRVKFTDKGYPICPACGGLVWIYDAAKGMIRRKLAEDLSIDPDKLIESDLETDSLDVVALVMDLEDELEITIPDSDYEGIKSIGDFLEYIKKRFPPPEELTS